MEPLTEQQEKGIEAYWEGRLSPEERTRLEKWLESSASGRDYLRFLEKMAGKAKAVPRLEPPADLADRVMEKLAAPPNRSRLLGTWATPRWGLALLLVLLVSIGFFYHQATSQAPSAEVTLNLHAPGAKSVEVAGDFTGWKPAPLASRDGWWRFKVKLTPDRDYQYAFILNGNVLILDPHQPQAVRDRRGDFYSVLSFDPKDGQGMKKISATEKARRSGKVLATFFSILLPTAALADTAPVATALSHLQQKAEKAGLSASQSKALVEKAGKLEEEGLTDATLEALVGESLSLGKGKLAQKALDRTGFLVAQGLDAEEAGKVALKEVETTRKQKEKALDQDMAQTLASGLKEHATTSKPLVLTQKEMAEKLEQKREEWEERSENQKRIQAIQNDSLEQHK